MTKRIIDGMSAEQIVNGWTAHCGQVSMYGSLFDYLDSLCKPAPDWKDDVSKDNPILCWISNEPIPESGGEPFIRGTDYVFEITEEGYMAMRGYRWDYARPISPDECWKPPVINSSGMGTNDAE